MTSLFDYWRSSASYRVRIALGLANEPWTTRSVDLLTLENQSEGYVKQNPQGLVPTLKIDGLTLTQSLAIIEYIDETRQLGLIPDTPKDRATVRALAHSIAMDIHPICNIGVTRFVQEVSGETIENEAWMQHFISKGLTAFEAMLGEGPYCFEDRITLPDLCLIPQVYNAKRWNIDLSQMPKIRMISEKLETIPAFSAAHPDKTQR